jgi:hypothetical protein
MKLKYFFTIAKLSFIVLLPIVLLILPGNYFDDRQSMCFSMLFFDVQCYGCGLTRACQHLIHFQFEDAFAYNALSFIAFPALAIVWIQWFMKEWKLFNRLRPATPIDSIL